jgi:hypothetical protein
MGKVMDTPEFLTEASLATFYEADNYPMNDYPVPLGGWKTFINEFFAREIDPALRAIDKPADPTVIPMLLLTAGGRLMIRQKLLYSIPSQFLGVSSSYWRMVKSWKQKSYQVYATSSRRQARLERKVEVDPAAGVGLQTIRVTIFCKYGASYWIIQTSASLRFYQWVWPRSRL